MTLAQEKAKAAFDKAVLQLRKCLGSQQGGKKAEASYAVAYQGMVRVGLAPQIRGKYRS